MSETVGNKTSMESLFTVENLFGLIMLTLVEVLLGIDNILFISVVMSKLRQPDQFRARKLWIFSGILLRILLLAAIIWLLRNGDAIALRLAGRAFNLRSVILFAGGFFLLYKAVKEIHEKLEGEEVNIEGIRKLRSALPSVMLQVILVDLVFSFDSTITAIGMSGRLEVMIVAVIMSMILLYLFSGQISSFIKKHPTVKMLTLTFLVMIGLVLIADGWDMNMVREMRLRSFLYFIMAFCLLMELLNMYIRRKKTEPIQLRQPAADSELTETLFNKKKST